MTNDQFQRKFSNYRDQHSSVQYRTVRSRSNENSSMPEEYSYKEIIQSHGNNEFVEEKRFVKRSSWSPAVLQERGLPPNGKRSEHESINQYKKEPNRVRIRPKISQFQHVQLQNSSSNRPISFTERYSRHLMHQNQTNNNQTTLNRHHSFSLNRRNDTSLSPTPLSFDNNRQMNHRTSRSPSNSDFISDTSVSSSFGNNHTLTSLSSRLSLPGSIGSLNSCFDQTNSSKRPSRRSYLSEYQHANSIDINYKTLTPTTNTNAVPRSSPISSSPPSFSSISTTTSFTCSKGHEQLSTSSSPSLSSSPMRSSLNQYIEFTSQTPTADTSRDNISSRTTTRTVMTMSMSPNHHDNQTRSAKAIISSSQISPNIDLTNATNKSDGLKQQTQEDQTASIHATSVNSCLKSSNNIHHTNNHRKKSVHFNWHLTPEEKRSTSSTSSLSTSAQLVKATCSNYRPSTVTIASSFVLVNENGNGDNDEQKKKDDEWRDVGTIREKEKIETTTRTIIANPLTNNKPSTIHRSFSLSSSPSTSNEESNDSRPHRKEEEKKENVDESNCTSSRRVTTAAAAAHLQCTANIAPVTFNDASNNNVSKKIESNSTNNCNLVSFKRPSSIDKSMPSNSLLVKTSSLNTIANPQPSTSLSTSNTAKKLLSQGFLSLIGRSNSNNNKSPSTNEENKQLRRTSSTQLRAQQRKAKQQTTLTTGTNGNKRLSADVESLLPVSSDETNHSEISHDDRRLFDKVTPSRDSERRSPMSLTLSSNEKKSTNLRISNLDLSHSLCNNMNISDNSTSMSSKSTVTGTLKSSETDSLNNGLLFQPVIDRKCDYVLHEHQANRKEPFFLSAPKSPSNAEDSMMMKTSTLVISTPPQYHYYLYPPMNNTSTLSSSSSSSTASSTSLTSKRTAKIISSTNRTISNVSINSVSTNSSSSYPSYESQLHDPDYQQNNQVPLHPDEETLSSSSNSIPINNRARTKKNVQSALMDWKMKTSSDSASDSSIRSKPVILSDSVQAFWPPPPTSTSPGEIEQTMPIVSSLDQATKQADAVASSSSNNSPSSISNNNSMQCLLVDSGPIREEMTSYSEENVFTKNPLRTASDTSLDDTQASYTERLREKSRSIQMHGNHLHNPELHPFIRRSGSKDGLNELPFRQHSSNTFIDLTVNNDKTQRLQLNNIQSIIEPIKTQEPSSNNDFQSKREFFENRTYTERTQINGLSPTGSNGNKTKVYTLYPSHSPSTGNNHSNQSLSPVKTENNQHSNNVTRQLWSDFQSSSTTIVPSPSFDSITNVTSYANNRKPVRIVKAIQRFPSSHNETTTTTITSTNINTNRPLSASRTYSLAKPGLFSASPINSAQKTTQKALNNSRRFQFRDENDLELNLKDFAARYPNHNSFIELARSTLTEEHRLSTDYTRLLFPISDRLRRLRSRQSSAVDSSLSSKSTPPPLESIQRTVSNDSTFFDNQTRRQADEFVDNLKRRLNMLKENQRTINDEIEENRALGSKLLKLIESNAEANESDKYKLHINEIDTITSVLLKLSGRLAKIENDLLTNFDVESSEKAALIERREQVRQKHDEAKALKDGIDRRSRLVTNIVRKYLTAEQFDDYEHFIRMKSTLLMDAKDVEEHLNRTEKQIEILTKISRSFSTDVNKQNRYSTTIGYFRSFDGSNHDENLPQNSFKSILSTA